jgi:ribosome-binding protein aMBF1 (putative translation factor)
MDSPEVQKLLSRQSDKNIPLGDSGPMGDLVGQILGTESRGGDINAFWGDRSGQYNDLLGGKKVSEMTFGELRKFQKNLTERTKGRVPGTDKGTSAVGIGQWLGSTLFGKNYDDTGFLKEYFGENTNYNNVVFDETTQKDMMKEFLKSPKHGNLEGFMVGNAGTPEQFAKHLGRKWQGVQPEKHQKQLVETLKKLQAEPGLNIDTALDKVMGQMNKLGQQANTFKDTLGDASKKVGQNIRELRNFLGMSQSDLGRAMSHLGIPMKAAEVSRIETGTRRIGVEQLVAFAQALDVSVLSLLREPGWSKFPWSAEIDRQVVVR